MFSTAPARLALIHPSKSIYAISSVLETAFSVQPIFVRRRGADWSSSFIVVEEEEVLPGEIAPPRIGHALPSGKWSSPD